VAAARETALGTDADPVMLEVFNNLFMNIAEQMGATLQNTAYSVNIKERLDFSCALFDAGGNLVANAPHVPVHLGSMSDAVRTVARLNKGDIAPGDAFMLNAPFNGGTHLPDVTVITPVFGEDGDDILFWVGSRGHHADIGGKTPGSGPPDSTHIDEEGVLIDNFRLVERGTFRAEDTRALLSSGPYPCRNVDQNMADLEAQIAANETGIREVRAMIANFGLDTVLAYMRHVQDNAEASVRRVIGSLTDGTCTYPLDDGSEIRVAITVDRDRGEADDRLHRHQPAAPPQLQRAEGHRDGRRPLCLPHARRPRHPAERGLPETAAPDPARTVHDQPRIPRRRDRREYRGQPGHHRRRSTARSTSSRAARGR
jgi:5-oxoprolinase (ATP-hydrolysing)